MNSSSTTWYGAGPTSFQTPNMHQSHLHIYPMTQVEPTSCLTPLRHEGRLSCSGYPVPFDNLAGLQTAFPICEPQREPLSPNSGDISALTPSQSLSTFLSDRSIGLSGGVQESSSLNETSSTSYLVRRRGLSATLLTPTTSRGSKEGSTLENAIEDVTGIGGATGEHPALLRGINGCNRPNIYSSDVQDFERLTEGAGVFNIPYPQPEVDRFRTLSTFTSNQSKQEAKPWSELALQHHAREVLPENLKDEDLSFAFEQPIADTDEPVPAELLINEATGPANLPAKNYHRSSRKERVRGRQKISKKPRKKPSRQNQSLLFDLRRAAVSPVTSVASTNSNNNHGGRQEGYRLPEEDRISAKQVREQGACLRCVKMREKCTPGQPPCENCKRVAKCSKFRNWMTPCTFKRLDERYEYLFPASLASQVAVPRMRALLNQYTAGHPWKFLLRLSIGFGELWTFWAVEIVPGSHEVGQMFGFHRQSAAEQQDLSISELTNPPVVPLWIDPLLMRVNIDCWLERMIGDPRAGWQSHWFPDRSQTWQSKILWRICQHYQWHEPTCDAVEKIAQQTLRWALKMSVLSYVMSHAFLVPQNDNEFLFRQLINPFFKGKCPPRKVCSRAANKFVKMMVLPMLRLATQRTLSGLHQLFRASEPYISIWASSFAVVFLCLMVVGSAQRSLFQRAVICAANEAPSYSRADAASEAEMMYSELAEHIIGMFHDTFHTSSNRKGLNPFRNGGMKECESVSAFAVDVRTTTEWHYRIPFDDNRSNIGAELLLGRFMRPFLSKLPSVSDVIAAR